jgi:hypothetical protein
MTYNETEILIKKYLNGETTAEEERTLACEVAREDVPDDWKVIAGMLGELTVDEALFDQMMAERKTKPRIVRLWPWVAAACVAAILIVFLGPPRKETITEPQIAKVEPKTKSVEVKGTEPKAIEPKEQNISQVTARPRQPHKANRRANVSKRIAKEEIPTPRPVEESDIVPFEDPRMQFAEQARTLRERGNRVIQRVSMNGLPSNNYQLNDL